MADAAITPLLTSHEAKPAKAPSIDDAIETYIGATGARQLLRAMLLAFVWAFEAPQVFMSVFTDAEPTWHCTSVEAAAGDPGSSCSPAASAAASPCALPPGTWEWDRPAGTSVVSEWALKCSGGGPALVSLPASSFFAGNLAGGFLLTTLADTHLGRRKMLVLSLVAMSVTGVLTAFSPNVWVYAALRFVCGFGRSMVGTSAMVLSTELVGKWWRNTVSVAGFVFFTVGFVSLPALAYTFREASWRNMYLWTSLPSLCYAVLLYFLVQESPRWLLVRGRKQEAIEAVRQIASLNGGGEDITTSSFSMLDACDVDLRDGVAGGEGMFATLRSIWERRWALQRLAAITTASFGVGMVYYGMPLNVGSLSSDIYLSVAYNAVAELPSSILSWLLMGRFNRRSSVVALTAASGLCSLACVVIPEEAVTGADLRLAAELSSFFASCAAYDVMLMYSIELFPTSVRNSAVGLVRQAAVLGGVVAPMLVAVGRERSFWSFGVFGLAVGFLGLFVTCLPETKGRSLSDTMEEEEEEAAAVLSSSGVDDI
uniref:H(+)/Pi cotransporter n=1 Tax=Oryza punctata TaxID=4537 RepID=A0A0E0LM77_ORYPU